MERDTKRPAVAGTQDVDTHHPSQALVGPRTAVLSKQRMERSIVPTTPKAGWIQEGLLPFYLVEGTVLTELPAFHLGEPQRVREKTKHFYVIKIIHSF